MCTQSLLGSDSSLFLPGKRLYDHCIDDMDCKKQEVLILNTKVLLAGHSVDLYRYLIHR